MNKDNTKIVQTRSETNGICYHATLVAAFEASEKDKSICKISFTFNSERVRLIRENRIDSGPYSDGCPYPTNYWKYDPTC